MLNYMNSIYPVRYTVFGLCCLGLLLSLFSLLVFHTGVLAALVLLGLVCVGWYDLRQTKKSVLRNYPVIGHMRYMLEFVRPEIRQYFIEADNDANPFSRAQRALVYQRAKAISTSGRLAPSWMCWPKGTSGSTIRWRPPMWTHTTFASPLAWIPTPGCRPPAPAAPSRTAPVCSASRP